VKTHRRLNDLTWTIWMTTYFFYFISSAL
jgi:hypothetical protein